MHCARLRLQRWGESEHWKALQRSLTRGAQPLRKHHQRAASQLSWMLTPPSLQAYDVRTLPPGSDRRMRVLPSDSPSSIRYCQVGQVGFGRHDCSALSRGALDPPCVSGSRIRDAAVDCSNQEPAGRSHTHPEKKHLSSTNGAQPNPTTP